MSITREQVADLQPGDVVEVVTDRWPGVVMRGPLAASRGYLSVGPWAVRNPDGTPYADLGDRTTRTLTLVSRAPRPLYVNHPRTEPVPGDVVRDADDAASSEVWCYADDDNRCWLSNDWEPDGWRSRNQLPARLRLLVDGETGQAVPSS